jgi:hypothetical protein
MLMLEEVVEYHVRQKRARFLYMVSELMDDLPSSDSDSDSDVESRDDASSSSSSSSESSSSFVSSISFSSSISHDSTSTQHESSDSGDLDFDLEGFETLFFRRWDIQTQALAIEILSARVLEDSPPVKKSGQIDLYLAGFRHDHPGRFRKKLRVSPVVFDRLVESIQNHNIFHNQSNVPQLPVPIQLAIFLVRVGHYGNSSSPEYVAQWAGVSVGTVVNATYRCLVAFLALHDEVVMIPPEEEKERAKEYVERVTCPEWRNGFLLADGTKFALFQKPGLHGEAWFDKNKDYSMDCQVCS